ncbi:protein FAR-RED ELONGATED HYPOCOTYL 3-like [Benincasa hispida]|uniref:protein FAR-RED ELONGATED HYPOCOTYL 3-like n=1 Tax=Benincasa hispida TaxID=102211 RepID=UPI001900C048|nr:protein FAR-RED ELONGATED HYPOCOTYL 3-like [Benincasa hispida]
MRRDYGVNISCDKAWCAREAEYDLTRGTSEYSYSILHAYEEMLKIENPGTVFKIKLEDDVHFKYMFMALGPCIRDFTSYWPLIIVDGSHLKGKYKGTMLVAVSMDGNNQLYPLAYVMVDNETDRSWKWFMLNLKCSIGEPDNLVFVSDRMVSISNVIRAFFPTSFHGLCTWHIEQNLITNFKDSTIVGIFRYAARAFRMTEF